MKSLKYTSFFFCVFYLFSCSSEDATSLLPKVSLCCSIDNVESTAKGGGIKSQNTEADVSVLVEGVELVVENLQYDVDDVVSKYYFDKPKSIGFSNGESLDIVLDEVTTGRNSIVVKGICKNEAINNIYTDIKKCDGVNLDESIILYNQYLKEIHPVYADYYNQKEVIKDISVDSDNTVNVPLITDSHRLTVVIENLENSEYLLKVDIKDEEGKLLLGLADYIENGTQAAFVINDEAAKGDRQYVVNIRCFDKETKEELVNQNLKRNIEASARMNISKLFVVTEGVISESGSSFGLTWVPMVENNSGELLN